MTDNSHSSSADEELTCGDPISRRSLLKQVAGTGATLALGKSALFAQGQASPKEAVNIAQSHRSNVVDVELVINGAPTKLQVDPRVTLLDALREHLGLTGTKKGCDHGQCGACTVLVNGRRINSCLSLALMHEGDAITTIEGLAQGEALHPVQAAFVEHDGFQCGYCTPGQICSAVALLKEDHAKTDEQIREWMSGNICRCGAYSNIVAAIRDAKSKMEKAV